MKIVRGQKRTKNQRRRERVGKFAQRELTAWNEYQHWLIRDPKRSLKALHAFWKLYAGKPITRVEY